MHKDEERNELIAIAELLPQPNGFLLELGCGDGRLAQRLLGLGIETVGVDPTIERVARARRRGAPRHLVVADGQHLPFRERSFDQALFGWSL